MSHQDYKLELVDGDGGEALMDVVHRTFSRRVIHAYAIRVLRLPNIRGNELERLAFLVELPAGDLLVAETTTELLGNICDELSLAPRHH